MITKVAAIILYTLGLGAVNFVHAQGMTPVEECEQKKSQNWRQQIRDCSRSDVRLFGQNALTEAEVAEQLKQAIFEGPDGIVYPKEGQVYLAQASYALEVEPLDGMLTFHCEGEKVGAFKHEVQFAIVLDEPLFGGSNVYLGTAEVFRKSDGSLSCVDPSTASLVAPVK